MRFVGVGLGALIGTAVALVVFAAVFASVAFDLRALTDALGWYGVAVFAGFPALVGIAAWRSG